jgi:hypothetical protein
MRYYDYEWDLDPKRIVLDQDLDIDALGWQSGDYFKVTNIDGRTVLVKVDPLKKFIDDGACNG